MGSGGIVYGAGTVIFNLFIIWAQYSLCNVIRILKTQYVHSNVNILFQLCKNTKDWQH